MILVGAVEVELGSIELCGWMVLSTSLKTEALELLGCAALRASRRKWCQAWAIGVCWAVDFDWSSCDAYVAGRRIRPEILEVGDLDHI